MAQDGLAFVGVHCPWRCVCVCVCARVRVCVCVWPGTCPRHGMCASTQKHFAGGGRQQVGMPRAAWEPGCAAASVAASAHAERWHGVNWCALTWPRPTRLFSHRPRVPAAPISLVLLHHRAMAPGPPAHHRQQAAVFEQVGERSPPSSRCLYVLCMCERHAAKRCCTCCLPGWAPASASASAWRQSVVDAVMTSTTTCTHG